MLGLLQAHSNMIQTSQPYILSTFINILEDYILDELILPENYKDIITILEQTYEKTRSTENFDRTIFGLKLACLSLTSSFSIILIAQGAPDDIKILEGILGLILSELFKTYKKDEEDQVYDNTMFTTVVIGVMTILNRVIIANVKFFSELIQSML